MESKLSPTVVIKSVTLTDSPSAKVVAEIVDMDSFRLDDEELQQYIKAYCILTNSTTTIPDFLAGGSHIDNPEWYDSYTYGNLADGQKISTDFNSNTCTFEIDIEDIVTPNSDGTSWSCSNMSFFAYIQIDAEQIASDHEITVSGMAGNYTTGVILEDNEIIEGYDIVIDMRELDDTE
jgi:hypothetical protein|tara:strand:+ start:43 stop:576 length:534 start_codon:yes stop_codon:yes gene_type:complete